MLKRMVLLILLAVLLCSTRIYAATPKQEVVFSFDFNKRFKLATNQMGSISSALRRMLRGKPTLNMSALFR